MDFIAIASSPAILSYSIRLARAWFCMGIGKIGRYVDGCSAITIHTFDAIYSNRRRRAFCKANREYVSNCAKIYNLYLAS